MKCLVIDDEYLARKGIIKHAKEIESLEVVGDCASASAAIEHLHKGRIDLLFLDIEMPTMDGLSMLKTLENPPIVIITTAYAEYAIDGYDLSVCDYLLKPISFERFLKAVNKAKKEFNRQIQSSTNEKSKYVYLKNEHDYYKIFTNEIAYVKAYKDYVFVYTEKERFLALVNIKNIAQQLPYKDFIRVHRSYLVAKNHISALKGNRLIVNDIEIPVGKTFKKQVFSELIEGKVIKR